MKRTKQVERDTLTVEELRRRLGIGRDLAYHAARSGMIPTLRIGRRLLIPRAALERFLREREAVK